MITETMIYILLIVDIIFIVAYIRLRTLVIGGCALAFKEIDELIDVITKRDEVINDMIDLLSLVPELLSDDDTKKEEFGDEADQIRNDLDENKIGNCDRYNFIRKNKK